MFSVIMSSCFLRVNCGFRMWTPFTREDFTNQVNLFDGHVHLFDGQCMLSQSKISKRVGIPKSFCSKPP